MYADLNEDGKITAMDVTYLGHTTAPRFVYGFGANFVYKNFDFGFFAQAFSSCCEQRLLFIAVHRLLIAVASLVVEHRLYVCRLQ